MPEHSPAALCGVILAGGEARRMGGQDKGLLPLAGQPLIAHAIRVLHPQVGELLLSASRHIERYRAFGYPVVTDPIGPFCGPLAGVLAALDAIRSPHLLTAPCDSPLLAADYARRFYAALVESKAEACVAHDGHRPQPVFILLKTDLRDSLRDYLLAGGRRIDTWLYSRRLVEVDCSDWPTMFRNLNTPAELAALEAELRSASLPMTGG